MSNLEMGISCDFLDKRPTDTKKKRNPQRFPSYYHKLVHHTCCLSFLSGTDISTTKMIPVLPQVGYCSIILPAPSLSPVPFKVLAFSYLLYITARSTANVIANRLVIRVRPCSPHRPLHAYISIQEIQAPA